MTGVQTCALPIFVRSSRRCALCFQLSGDLGEKKGQIAHLDQDPSNTAEDNLAFMCLEHHSLFDSRTSQHKNYTPHEVKAARRRLHDAIAQQVHVTAPAVDARMAEERARLSIFLPPDASQKTWQFLPAQSMLEILYILPAAKNYGRTEARITAGRAKLLNVPKGEQLPTDPDYGAAGFQIVDTEILLPPEAIVQPFRLGISNLDFKPIYEGRSTIWIYGFIDYRDIYDRPHQSRFCFLYHVPGGFNPGPAGWYGGGPPLYSRCT